jgi:prepilin-type N-terminal cleavage/methylation domain-containing protein
MKRSITPTKRVLGVADHLRRTRERGFTIVELIVVVTVISILTTLAMSAYNKVVNDTKLAIANALVSTLMTAKTAFVADPSTSSAAIQQFNSDPDANFASIAPYIRVNGAQPASEDDLRKLERLPASTSIALGTVDDSGLGGSNADQAPAVTFTRLRHTVASGGQRQIGDFETHSHAYREEVGHNENNTNSDGKRANFE